MQPVVGGDDLRRIGGSGQYLRDQRVGIEGDGGYELLKLLSDEGLGGLLGCILLRLLRILLVIQALIWQALVWRAGIGVLRLGILLGLLRIRLRVLLPIRLGCGLSRVAVGRRLGLRISDVIRGGLNVLRTGILRRSLWPEALASRK